MGTVRTAKRILRSGARLGALATSSLSMLPDFLIVGGKRCGSTSLYRYVVRHPAILPCRVTKGTHYFDVNYLKGWSWYRSQFPSRLRAGLAERARGVPPITGEASPYYMFHPLAPERIAGHLPEVKLIAVLRDPVIRAWSHYQYSVRRGFEHLPIEEALERESGRLAGEDERLRSDPAYQSFSHRHHTYLARGRYAEHLESLSEHVPPSRVLVLQSEQMFADPKQTLKLIFDFLGLEQVELTGLPPYNAGSYDDMPAHVRARLEAYYAEPNARLYALPGVDFRWDRPA
ncbi:MAG: sulfotransferase domain-containing protein [Actinomycetota bacterium]